MDLDVTGFDRVVYALVGARFVNVLGSGVVYPFATLYFYRELGIPFALVGTGLFANSVASAGGTALGGYLADRHGQRPVLVGSMAASAVTLAAYALVTTAGEFVAVAAAAGLTMGLYAPASQAMLADHTASADRERAFGLLKVASNAGFGSGFVVGGVLYGVAHTAVFVADGLTSALVAVVLVAVLPRSGGGTAATARDALGRWADAVTEPRLVALAVLNVGFAVAYAQMQSTVPVFAADHLGLSSEQLGTLYVLNPLVVVLGQLPAVALVERWRRTRGLVLSAGFWAASFVAVAAAHYVPVLVGVALVGAFLVLRTVGELLHAPLVTALGSEMASVDARGSQLSLLEVAKRVGFGVGPLLGGLFFDYGAEALLWPALVGTCALLAVGLVALERTLTRVENGGGAPPETEG
ncbi:MAG: MFS transporter [Halobacteriaceae archaeon]